MAGRTTSARSMLSSFVLHGLVLGLLALVPTKMLDRSTRPREVDVVFRRLLPRVQAPPEESYDARMDETTSRRRCPKRGTWRSECCAVERHVEQDEILPDCPGKDGSACPETTARWRIVGGSVKPA